MPLYSARYDDLYGIGGIGLAYREKDLGEINRQGHRDNGSYCTHDYDFCSEIHIILEFNCVKDGIGRGRNTGHNHDNLTDNGREPRAPGIP